VGTTCLYFAIHGSAPCTCWGYPKSRHNVYRPVRDCLPCTTGNSYWRTRGCYKYITSALWRPGYG
jgi:hypothetical protein